MAFSLEELAARAGCTVAELEAAATARVPMPGQARYEAVPESAEWRRIKHLPYREPPTPEQADQLVALMTRAFRTPWGERTLRRVQAFAVWEMIVCNGAFVYAVAGGGKTAIAWLAMQALGAVRALHIVPKKLLDKTQKEYAIEAKHWLGPDPAAVQVITYEFLSNPKQGVHFDDEGNVTQDEFLERYDPDLIIADECQKFRRPRAVARLRMQRFRDGHPNARYVLLTATPAKEGVENYAHMVEWCIPRGSPLPTRRHRAVLQDWAAALDDKIEIRMRPGALLDFCPESKARAALAPPGSELETRFGRHAFRRRFGGTPGVVVSPAEPLEGVALTLNPILPPRNPDGTLGDPALEEHFKRLRTLMINVQGEPIPDGKTEWAVEGQLANGLEYIWDPPPPDIWRERRRECFAWARAALIRNGYNLDSWKPLKDAVRVGLINDGGVIARWLEVEKSFTPNVVPVWLSNEALNVAANWLANHSRGVVWVKHRFFGQRLAELTGLPYFGEENTDARTGLPIIGPDLQPSIKGPCIASIKANGEGFNMQWWNSQLFMTLPQDPVGCEQTIARLHRAGQTEPRVDTYYWAGSYQLVAGYWMAREGATAIAERDGGTQRILYATSDEPLPTIDDARSFGGYRWRR